MSAFARLAGAAIALALIAQPATAARKREPAAPPPNEGGLIDNVDGLTLDEDGRVRRFTGLLIGKDGNVKRLLAAGDKRPEWLDFKLDGRGRVLMPGLIDAHGHVMDLGFRALRLDLFATTSLADAQNALGRYAREHETPTWIQGGGWNQERWKLGRFPTAADLDAVVPDRPVVLERVDGHALLANSAAMREAGITAATKDPPGGRIERDAKGNPTGTFVDAAMELVWRAVPAPLPRERDEALARAQDILLGSGITATADMGTTAEDWNVYRRAGDAGRLRVRLLSYAKGIEPLLAVAGTGKTPWLYGDRLRMVGVKLYADGALGSRGAWLKHPYSDAATRGLQFLDDTKIRNLMSRAAMDGFQVAVHAIGDAANAQALGAIEEVAETYKGDRRWRIEHAQIVDPADLPRFGRTGIIASMQPVHETSDWQMAGTRLGEGRLGGAYAWATMIKAGARLAFGSDYPVESPNPFPGLAAAISREDAEGQPPGGWRPQEKVTIEQALAGFTTGAAYAGFAEDRLGSLTPGKRADFILVDRNPLTAAPRELRATQVYETWVGGQRVWIRK
ncbi:amidohydrolase [Sphingomonas jatrophae]|uniref:Amidohydrolase 3 domain-containing protein n=1 Tax=Sphingomonas jatrophae TaxID=1166337 RepID=A0A1I6LGM7_9SPHN|nr:amidohydrolase [Sphingomonas jatrophae]SFS02611.1 hypothetical protein SAMN05192580_2717 [Sphingomonas jatrophae]